MPALTRSYYSYIHDLARLGVLSTLSRWIRAHFRGLPSVALPEEVVGSSPTGKADFSFFLSFRLTHSSHISIGCENYGSF